ncbi:MAG: hypothetical protein C5B45_00635 [Chlamydiae bacterium]|nr:MAG: hypothetical protein C5B45_00635 [Chlamydiota bacterium]
MSPSNLQKALIVAIKTGDLETVRVIIIASNNLKDVYFPNLKRTLIESIKNGHVELAKAIMTSDGFANIYNLKGALIEAMKGGHLKIARVIVASDRFKRNPFRDDEMFMEAIKGGHIEIAKTIITFDHFKNVFLSTLQRIFRQLSKDNHLKQEVLTEFNKR